MSETMIAALISAAVTLLVCVVNNHYQNSKLQALLEYRMDVLEEKQDKYNNIIARTYKLEQDAAVHSERIAALSDAIEDMKD